MDAVGLMVAALGCVIPDCKGVYVAVPITTGFRLWSLARGSGLRDISQVRKAIPDLYRRDVLIRNMEAAHAVVSRLRAKRAYVVNPAELEVEGWSQQEYSRLWKRVLLEKTESMVLSEGWEFSRGCVEEFVIAVGNCIQLLTEELTPYTMERAITDLKGARSLAAEWEIEADFLDGALREVRPRLARKTAKLE